MRFIDEAKITIHAGHGGKGCVSFRRETFVPRGGPDGGDGGRGGSVIFRASVQLSTLADFRYKRIIRAQDGKGGGGANKSGLAGEDIIIRIPTGTLLKDPETDDLLQDFTEDGQEWIACKGGRGGKGNWHFRTATFQAPKFAQPGEEGETRAIKLELKLLADAGIIGLPNAGKSTLLSRISAAHPKIADYPFTTLQPMLGVVRIDEAAHMVVADLPGLIEGAHTGVGLGHRFLKHVERTAVMIHALSAEALLNPDGVKELKHNYDVVQSELLQFNVDLPERPQIIALTKIDLIPEDDRSALLAEIQDLLGAQVFAISSATGEGLAELVQETYRRVKDVRAVENVAEQAPYLTLNPAELAQRDRDLRWSV